MTTVYIAILCGLLAVVYGIVTSQQVLRASPGNERMQDIAAAIQEGAKAYLGRQYTTIAIVGVVVAVIIFATLGVLSTVGFLIGAVLSGVAGYVGMNISVRANVRTAEAARGTLQGGLTMAFRSGAVTGMLVAGLGLLAIAGFFWYLTGPGGYAPNARVIIEALTALAFGASLISIFARLGGGIFTKAADVGADLVGKVEAGIPEDDPRNAATIADNVGDNVGDCAGMAADLFESYAVMLVAALILGSAAFGAHGLVFPLLIPAIGAVTAMIGIFITRARSGESALDAINRGFFISAAISAVLCAAAAYLYLPGTYAELGSSDETVAQLVGDPRRAALLAVVLGIVLAAVILRMTGYYTGTDKRPTMDVARTTETGAATVILSGISLGLESAVYKVVTIAVCIYLAFLLGGSSVVLGLFFIALAGCGLLTTVGVIVAMDTFGPVSDNAQGIAEMSGDVDGEAAQVLTELDAVGNTTKAITKGIAIATAVLAATALFGSYTDAWRGALSTVDEGSVTAQQVADLELMVNTQIVTPSVLVGLLLGAAVVFLFSGLAVNAVTVAAGSIVHEVRRQFREHPGIMEGTEKPEYARVVDICTRDSLAKLATPGLLAALTPIVVGFGLGIGALAGFLAGAIACGALMAVFLANSGGAWDNAKKIVEDGHHGGKGSPGHEAAVIGDTVGDPFKDTAGPAINPLIKVMNLVAVLIAPAVITLYLGDDTDQLVRWAIALVALLVVAAALVITKRDDVAVGDGDGEGVPAVDRT